MHEQSGILPPPPSSYRTLQRVFLALLLLVLLGILTGPGLVRALRAPVHDPPLSSEALAFKGLVQEQVRETRLKPQERIWENGGWMYEPDEALRQARENNRPLLVYCVDGHLDGRS